MHNSVFFPWQQPPAPAHSPARNPPAPPASPSPGFINTKQKLSWAGPSVTGARLGPPAPWAGGSAPVRAHLGVQGPGGARSVEQQGHGAPVGVLWVCAGAGIQPPQLPGASWLPALPRSRRGCPGGARGCPGDAQGVPRRCPGCAQEVPRECPGGAQGVPRRCPLSWGPAQDAGDKSGCKLRSVGADGGS